MSGELALSCPVTTRIPPTTPSSLPTPKDLRGCLEHALAVRKLEHGDAAERGLGLPVLGVNIGLGHVVDLDGNVIVLGSDKDPHGLVVALGGVKSEHSWVFCLKMEKMLLCIWILW